MDALRAHFAEQAIACEGLGSPLTARVLRLIAADLKPGTPVADRLLRWQDKADLRADAVALRLAGGLHALVLQGRDVALQSLYAVPAVPDADARDVLNGALLRHADFLVPWLESAPQTNEVRRSTILIAAGHWLAAQFGLPLVLSELGASAGLNLIWDHYRLAVGEGYGPKDSPVVLTPEWRGALPPHALPRVATRAGVDLRPLRPSEDRLRLLSYIWADQADRLLRTEVAAGMAARFAPGINKGDAVDWLEARLAEPFPGHLHLMYHTIAWQYFPPDAQAKGRRLLDEAGARATADTPLAHLAMEADASPNGAGLTLQHWPGGEVVTLGRADFHGRWVEWQAPPGSVSV